MVVEDEVLLGGAGGHQLPHQHAEVAPQREGHPVGEVGARHTHRVQLNIQTRVLHYITICQSTTQWEIKLKDSKIIQNGTDFSVAQHVHLSWC